VWFDSAPAEAGAALTTKVNADRESRTAVQSSSSQPRDSWHACPQDLVPAFHTASAMFFTPFTCVAWTNAPWHVVHVMSGRPMWSEWLPVGGGSEWHVPHAPCAAPPSHVGAFAPFPPGKFPWQYVAAQPVAKYVGDAPPVRASVPNAMSLGESSR
jgi:hypothetical protein